MRLLFHIGHESFMKVLLQGSKVRYPLRIARLIMLLFVLCIHVIQLRRIELIQALRAKEINNIKSFIFIVKSFAQNSRLWSFFLVDLKSHVKMLEKKKTSVVDVWKMWCMNKMAKNFLPKLKAIAWIAKRKGNNIYINENDTKWSLPNILRIYFSAFCWHVLHKTVT